jgi:hypothetical protein
VAFRKLPVGESTREYLNPAAFQQVTATAGCVPPYTACPALGTQGNISRNEFRGIPAYNVDAQISRIFPVQEWLKATLRLEAFNLLNHPNFGAPAANLNTTTTFGQVSSISNAARVFQGSVKLIF